jgi:NADPH:quinone reductase-like Zn-dependent oxidoreductase
MKTHLELLTGAFSAGGLLIAAIALGQTAGPTAIPKMKAIVYHEYGSPAVLRLEDVEKPVPNDNQVLVKVQAISLNPLDWHYMEGSPYIVRPLDAGLVKPTVARLGVDYAGTVEAVGKNATKFKPGDEVFGAKNGAFAEYVCVLADRNIVLKPANVTVEQAASVGIAGITALQALRDKGKVQPGQKVLINGASGGVGTFAVQIAKSYGAEVTGVCSGKNADMVRSLGAGRVIDYTKEDFTKGGQRYDLIIDNVGTQPLSGFRRVLQPNGRYVLIGGGGVNDDRWIGPMARPIKMLLLSPFVSQGMGMMLAEMNPADLTVLADLMQAGKLKPVIDRTYKFNEFPEAMRYIEAGHARGKVVVTVEPNTETLTATPGPAAGSAGATGPTFIAFELIAVAFVMTILPVILAFFSNRVFRRRNPEKRSYRWGYYFSIMSLLLGLVLALIMFESVTAAIVCFLVYAVLAWFFAQRHHWAWIALTILSFNPIAWIINAIYLRKRWAEEAAAA